MSRESTRQRQRDETREEEHPEPDCPECASTAVVSTSDGERICEECGLVLEENLVDRGPEWRAYNDREDEEKSRVGSSLTHRLHDKGLTTEIGWETDPESTQQREQLGRMRKWQKRIRMRGSAEYKRGYALGEIDRMASALGVPNSVREIAAVIYRRVQSEGLILGWSHESIASAALYVACRQEGIPRSLDELQVVSRVDSGKKLARAYRHLVRKLGLEVEPVDPKQYIPRFCSELDLGEEVRAKARDILDASADHGLNSGKAPSGLAAAAIYAASLLCEDKRTQEEIGEVAQVTEVTIRNRYQEQLEAFDASIAPKRSN